MKILTVITLMVLVCTSLLPLVGLGNFQQTESPECKDYDQDQLCLKEELGLGTNPYQADTDQDGLKDGVELKQGTNPLKSDTDQDGLTDGKEINRGTNPLSADTDGDGTGDSKDFFPRIKNQYIYQVCGVLIVTILGIGFLFATPRGLHSLESLMSKVTITSRKQEKKEAGLSISESKDMELRKCKDCAYLRGFRKEKKDGYTIISPKCNNYCGERESIIDLKNPQQEEV